jgi:predicted nuclease of predicted toxin-antitoxin system
LRLLFDQNLPHRFAASLADLFPGSLHVKDAGLATASDREIWDYAAANGFTIISKDGDFHQLSFLYGYPPKTIWLRCGNSRAGDLEKLIRYNHQVIEVFLAEDDGALLVIGSAGSARP